MKFKEHACAWCGSEDYDVVVRGADLLVGLPGEFQFVRCCQCGLYRQNPYLDWEDLKDYYPEDYSSYQPQAAEISSKVKRWDKRYGLWKRVNLVHKYAPSGRWVDIGAGTGRILQEASLWGKWELMGIEPVDNAAHYIRNTLGVEIFSDRLENFTGYQKTFDVVTMWDVMEHLEEPIKGIEKVREILKPGGHFVFAIPNMDSWDRKVFKKYWIGYDLPRHMTLFPTDLLRTVLQENGFEICQRTCIAGSHGAFMLDLAFWNRDVKSSLLTKVLGKGPDFILPRALTAAPLWLIDQLKMGSNITYVVRKK